MDLYLWNFYPQKLQLTTTNQYRKEPPKTEPHAPQGHCSPSQLIRPTDTNTGGTMNLDLILKTQAEIEDTMKQSHSKSISAFCWGKWTKQAFQLNECMQVRLCWRMLADLAMGRAEGDTGPFTSLCCRRQYQKWLLWFFFPTSKILIAEILSHNWPKENNRSLFKQKDGTGLCCTTLCK